MTTPEIVMWVVVGCVGLFASRRNLTAFALAVAWLVSQLYYLRTGHSLELSVYIKADIAVVTVIIAKGIVRASRDPWPALTIWDKCIIGLFVLGAWPIYVSTLSDKYVYWALYWITTAQFLLAAAEAAQSYSRSLRARPASPPRSDGLAYAGRAGGYV